MTAMPIKARRGRPIVAMAAIVIVWVAMRAMIWQSGDVGSGTADRFVALEQRDDFVLSTTPRSERPSENMGVGHDPNAFSTLSRPKPVAQPAYPEGIYGSSTHHLRVPGSSISATLPPRISHALEPKNVGLEGGYAVRAARYVEPSEGIDPAPAQPKRSASRRISADAWAFVRPDAGGAFVDGLRPASLGRSQAGAVLRYKLRPVRNAPFVYARASKALDVEEDAELAVGAGLRPFATLPVTAYAELRATDISGQRRLRPAAFVTAGFEAEPVALGFEARGYGAAGYVGGYYASAFADGVAIAEKPVAQTDAIKLSGGAGVWGGAQRGASRLDIGPSAGLSAKLGAANVRLQADYRLRVAGNASPGNGAAITLSAGF